MELVLSCKCPSGHINFSEASGRYGQLEMKHTADIISSAQPPQEHLNAQKVLLMSY